MTLNVLGKTYYCKEENKTIIIFRFSPKGFDNNVWTLLKTVKLIPNYCE